MLLLYYTSVMKKKNEFIDHCGYDVDVDILGVYLYMTFALVIMCNIIIIFVSKTSDNIYLNVLFV